MLVRHERPPVDRSAAGRRRHRTRRVLRDREVARHADDAGRILDDAAHALEERLAVEDRVGVDAADVPEARDVEAGVQRVRLAAVLLVDDDEVRVGGAAVDRAHRLRRENVPDEHLVRLELERLDQPVERSVSGSVVDRDDLELRILEPEQRLDGRHDGGLLVVRGNDHADRDREARLAEHVEVLARVLVPPHDVLDERDPDEGHVRQIRQQQVREADDHRHLEERPRHAARTPSAGMRSMRASAASRNRSPPAA